MLQTWGVDVLNTWSIYFTKQGKSAESCLLSCIFGKGSLTLAAALLCLFQASKLCENVILNGWSPLNNKHILTGVMFKHT